MRDKQPNLFSFSDESVFPFDIVLSGLANIKGLGRKGITAIVDSLDGRLENIRLLDYNRIYTILQSARLKDIQRLSEEICDIERVISVGSEKVRDLAKYKIQIIPGYALPHDLRKIENPPRWLYVEGNIAALYGKPNIAVVGTRRASIEGLSTTRLVVRVLGSYKLSVVSGLAEGIDDEAHRAALNAQINNVAFLGHGIDIYFPQSTEITRKRIIRQNGAVATEYLPGEMYKRSYFVERNRLQAALADIVIAVEAQSKSGTAHTTEFAKKFRKPIVGLKIPNSTLAESLREEGFLVVDLKTQEGYRNLDEVIQRAVRQAGGNPDPFHYLKQRLAYELKIRNSTPSSLADLASELYAMVVQEKNISDLNRRAKND